MTWNQLLNAAMGSFSVLEGLICQHRVTRLKQRCPSGMIEMPRTASARNALPPHPQRVRIVATQSDSGDRKAYLHKHCKDVITVNLRKAIPFSVPGHKDQMLHSNEED